MSTLHYQGFDGKTYSCRYAMGVVAEKPAVVFVQGPITGTSITNVIEVLASKVLCTDLAGRSPADVRFFEHYLPDLQPLAVWQEVTFAESHPLPNGDGLVAKLLGLVAGARPVESWVVDKPGWSPVSPALIPVLETFV